MLCGATRHLVEGCLPATGPLCDWPVLAAFDVARDANRRTRVHHLFYVARLLLPCCVLLRVLLVGNDAIQMGLHGLLGV